MCDTRPPIKCLLGLFQKLRVEHPRSVLRVVARERGHLSGEIGWDVEVVGLIHDKTAKHINRWKNHSGLHTLSHRGSQFTSQCFNPSSLQNKGATAIGGRGPIYTLASNRLLAAQRNLKLYKQAETDGEASSALWLHVVLVLVVGRSK